MNKPWYVKGNHLPLEVIIDLGERQLIAESTYLSDQGRWAGGYAFKFLNLVLLQNKHPHHQKS